MRQPRVLRINGIPLALGGRKLGQFLHLPGELLALGIARRRVGFVFGASPGQALPFAIRLSDGQRLLPQSGVLIEQAALHLATQQRLMRILAVYVHQLLASLTKLGECRRMTVDEAARASAVVHHAAQQHPVRVAFERLFRQPVLQLGLRLQGKLRGNLGTFGARAHLRRIGALAQRQGQSIDQYRLARPRFPGQRRESCLELQIQRFDDGEIPDRQVAQHVEARPAQYISLQCSFSRSIAK